MTLARRFRLCLAAGLALSVTLATPGQSQLIAPGPTVPGTANLWKAAGGNPTADGTAPPFVAVTSGAVVTFGPISGAINCCSSASPATPPDGDPIAQSVGSLGGISGIALPRQLPLLGVFLSATGQPVTAPSALDFNIIGIDFSSLSPQLGQSFFIGNGLRNDGTTLQQFFAPSGAAFLYFGIPDACGFNGPPSTCYSDNTGSFSIRSVNVQASTSTPEPGSLLLLGSGLLGIAGVVRRRHSA